jgi:hypothetical protein
VDDQLLVAGVEKVGAEDGVVDGDRVQRGVRGEVDHQEGVEGVRLEDHQLRVGAEVYLAQGVGGWEHGRSPIEAVSEVCKIVSLDLAILHPHQNFFSFGIYSHSNIVKVNCFIANLDYRKVVNLKSGGILRNVSKQK